VQLFDDLLRILAERPDFKSFMLDGQTIPLEDYLEIRPERRSELERFVREKRLIVGPWYVLPDPFLVSGEALIRNLMLGHKIANEFGGVMKEGYMPDPFSQIDQMPQILHGFDLCSFLFMRGMGKEFDDLGTEFLWEAPDGTRIFTVYLKDGYFNVGGLGFREAFADHRDEKPDFDLAVDTVKKAIESLRPFSKTGHFLLFNGTDHADAQPELPQMLTYINERLPDAHLKQGTVSDYVDVALKTHDGLRIHKGEFTGNIHHLIVRSVYSARMYLKQANHSNQTMLEKYAEPLAAFAWIEGKRDYSSFVWQGWKLLMQNQPHDDICGTSIDAVHMDMQNRFKQSQEIGEYVKDKAFGEFAELINTEKNSGLPVILYNPLNWERTEPVRAVFLVEAGMSDLKGFSIVDSNSSVVEHGVIERKQKYCAELLDWRSYEVAEIEFLARIPSCGYATFYAIPETRKRKKRGWLKKDHQIVATKRSISNEFLRVTVNSNGTLRIFDKIGGKVYNGCNLFEDTEDDGDEYSYSFIKRSKTYTTQRAIVRTFLVSKSTLSATIKIDIRFRIPESLNENRDRRSDKRVLCLVSSYVTLRTGVPRIDIATEVVNNAKDHRLRVWFPTGVSANHNYADGHFDVVERQNYFPDRPTGGAKSEFYSTQHQGCFVTVSDKESGLMIANKGLPEYEIVETKGKAAIALTLLRCVGWLNKNNLLTRWRMAGPDIATPEAQCLGKNTFHYSIIPTRGSWNESKTYKQAYNFNSPVVAYGTVRHGGRLPVAASLVRLEPDDLVLSAVKKSEDGNGLIVRFFNISNHEVKGRLSTYRKIEKASWVNLNEDLVRSLHVEEDGTVPLTVVKHKIVTIRLTFSEA
jgi:mannosylglycerate hydrolase